MKKKDLVELFLRSKSITILATEETLFERIAKEIVATVNSRYKYSNFSITPSKTLRSPYLTDQYFRYCDPNSHHQEPITDETIVIYTSTSIDLLELFPQYCSFARLED